MTFAKRSSSTQPVKTGKTPAETRQQQVREQARREIPALRKQAEQGIQTLKRLSERAEK